MFKTAVNLIATHHIHNPLDLTWCTEFECSKTKTEYIYHHKNPVMADRGSEATQAT
jgi:hypothetical protein